ncbi:MAG: glycosyltransferase family protein [Rhodocyclaceae bacterium]|nr:glycosyltransferase family protein [Rhodocyclaceae bacterium]
MTILAILQARTSSSRLPGKVLAPILGKPMLARQIERIRRTTLIDALMVATSEHASDDPIETLCADIGVTCVRGSLNDVLDRYYRAACSLANRPEHVVRLTGDCPLTDPEVIDATIRFHLAGGYDYTSNCLEPTFPHGLDVEVMRFAALEQAWKDATLASEHEHVTLFLYKNPERFRIGIYRNDVDLSGLRWTVDEAADLQVVEAIYAGLYPDHPQFATRDILNFLEANAWLKTLNTHFRRSAGLEKSLANDSVMSRKKA